MITTRQEKESQFSNEKENEKKNELKKTQYIKTTQILKILIRIIAMLANKVDEKNNKQIERFERLFIEGFEVVD